MDPPPFLFFPRALSLYIPQLPSLFKYKWRALKKKLSSKCRSPCCISHSESMSHQPHTCWKCVPRIMAPVSRFQVTGYYWFEWASRGMMQHGLWEVFMAAEKDPDFKSSIRRFGPQHMLSCELLNCNIYFRSTDLFPCCWVALICILYRCLLLTLNPNLLFSCVAILWGI